MKMLASDKTLAFDCLVIDEAHNLLDSGARAQLLAEAILISKKRNPTLLVRYLTPFLFSYESLQLRYTSSCLQGFVGNETLKMPKVFVWEDSHLLQYEQFFDCFYDCGEGYGDYLGLEFAKAMAKNIVYLNRPSSAESHARTLCANCGEVESKLVERFANDLAEVTHPDYFLIDCLKHGIAYHHGAMPEVVRRGVEYLFSEESKCRFLVTTSTLLEGVNLPATRMFLLDTRKGKGNLSPANFRNLIGRICRFGEVFGKTRNLDLLQPEVFVVRSEYMKSNANLKSFVRKTYEATKKHSDQVDNPALSRSSGGLLKERAVFEERLENFESGLVDGYSGRRVRTEVGSACARNNVTDFSIVDEEEGLTRELGVLNGAIEDVSQLVRVVAEVFLSKASDENLRRFSHEETINFYSMFLGWRIQNNPLSVMIAKFVGYWRQQIKSMSPKPAFVYVGSRWGEVAWDGKRPLWVNATKKSDKELVNLAIVRVHEEQEFVENNLLKYVDVLHDLGFVVDSLWKRLHYGTDDDSFIRLLRSGASHSLARLLVEKYRLESEQIGSQLVIPASIYSEMQSAGENILLLLEAKLFVEPHPGSHNVGE